MLKKIPTVLSITLLTGCASMFNGTTQTFSVATSNDKVQELTHCNIVNEEGSWQAPPNQTSTIHRDGNVMSINCDNTYQSGTNYVHPKFDGGYLLLDILTGYGMVIGIALDSFNNAFYSYPTFVSVAMQDKPGLVFPVKKSILVVDTPSPVIENNININNYPGASKVDVKEQSAKTSRDTFIEPDQDYFIGKKGKCYTLNKNGNRVVVDQSLCQ
jgi:hypothetical protein